MQRPLIIEAAINGATPQAANPHVPRSVAELVADMVRMAQRLGRPVATPAQAAEILQLRRCALGGMT